KATIEWIKLEKGNKATPYTPAPEDVENNIHSVNDVDVVSQKSEGGVIDGIEIGGRNLLEGSSELSRSWETDAHSSYKYLLRINISSILEKVKIGDELTFSMDIWAESATTLRVYDTNGKPSISFGSHNLSVPEGESRQSFTTKLTRDLKESTEWIMDVYNNNNGVKFE